MEDLWIGSWYTEDFREVGVCPVYCFTTWGQTKVPDLLWHLYSSKEMGEGQDSSRSWAESETKSQRNRHELVAGPEWQVLSDKEGGWQCLSQVSGRQITIRVWVMWDPVQRRSAQSGTLPSEPSHHPFLVDNIADTQADLKLWAQDPSASASQVIQLRNVQTYLFPYIQRLNCRALKIYLAN